MQPSSSLEALRVLNPCEVPWASMDGDDRVRFCDRCRKNVYNVAAMLPREALTLIRRNEGRVCVQLTRRRDGTLVTGDCWARLRRARRKGLLVFVAMLPVVLAAQVGAQLFGLQTLADFLRDAPKPGVSLPAPPTDWPSIGGEASPDPVPIIQELMVTGGYVGPIGPIGQ